METKKRKDKMKYEMRAVAVAKKDGKYLVQSTQLKYACYDIL